MMIFLEEDWTLLFSLIMAFIMPAGVAIYSIIENNKDIEYALKPKERCQVKITL
ncbi:TPA: hypothetical protein ACU22X_004563 [Salmonella enterica]|uniref:hypothetical protein n=1 Tax=Salmonella enterica TaxID=28901 RepID=UPI00331624AA